MAETYDLEYGKDALECHRDGLPAPARVLIVDDVLATGGTARAAGQLARTLGAEVVGWSFLLEIAGLGGPEKLDGAPGPRGGPALKPRLRGLSPGGPSGYHTGRPGRRRRGRDLRVYMKSGC